MPGGNALTVDRVRFAEEVTRAVSSEPLIELRREEVSCIPEDRITIIRELYKTGKLHAKLIEDK